MQRPSVLFINRVYPPARGASGRVLRDLAKAMAREGWDVTVLCTGAEDSLQSDGPIKVIKVKGQENPSGWLSYAFIWMRLMRAALRQPAAHLVVTMTDPPMQVLIGRMVQRSKKSRHIHWCQDLYPDLFPALGFKVPGFFVSALRKRGLRAIEQSDKVVVIGRCMAKSLTKQGVLPRRITMVPNWPDIELVSPPGKEGFNDVSNFYAEKLRLEEAATHRPHAEQVKDIPKFRVLYAGNLGRAHPVETILEAAKILRDDNPEIEFVFVGNGPVFDQIASERDKDHLANIRLLPYQPSSRLRSMMESGDLHIITMKMEAAGLLVPSKFYAALAVARPCVFLGPKQCEVAKVISDFGVGSVVPQGDARQLAEEILRYRYSSDDWFAAHHAAEEAGRVYVPKQAMEAWIERAWEVIEQDMRQVQSHKNQAEAA